MIAPSILNANYLKLDEQIKKAVNAGITRFHLDIMDGHFVPNLSFGPQLVSDFKREFPMIDAEIHMMAGNPEKLVPLFVNAGADIIELHYEAMEAAKLSYWLDYLHANSLQAAIALSPKTPISRIKPWADKIDQLLLMTVEPGLGQQSFLPASLAKIRAAKAEFNLPIEVDGGINRETAKLAKEAGADIFVAGSYIFRRGDIGRQIFLLQETLK